MKRIVSLFLACLLAVSCIALGASAEEKQLTFGYLAYNMKDEWQQYSYEAFQYACDQMGVKCVMLDCEYDLERSIQCMQELIDQKCDGIAVFPMNPDQGATLVSMANEAGIPISVENYHLDENAGDFIGTVACEYDIIGEAAMNYVNETWPGAKVLYVAGKASSGVYASYQEGVDRALAQEGFTVTLAQVVHGDWNTELSMNVTNDAINAGVEFDVIFANNEAQAKGCMNALIENGLQDKVKIVTTGGGPSGLEMLQNGEVTATMSAPVSLQGLMNFKNLYQFLHGKTPAKRTAVPVIPITKDTLDSCISWIVSDTAVDYIGGLE